MKRTNGFLFFAFPLALAWAVALGACENPIIPPEYTVEFPALPAAWQEMMGPAHWRLVWFNSQGISQSLETAGGGKTSIAAVSEWATPVLAFPYWPGRNIHPGEMRPAGGIIFFDATGSNLQLSWRGGVEAWFYRELSAARNAVVTIDAAALNKRRPEYFDWPRFRKLLDGETIPEAVREDPWLADWQNAAVRTVKSGFDRRYIKVLAGEELLVTGNALAEAIAPGSPNPDCSFTGPSPFAQSMAPEPGVGFRFKVTARPDIYVSTGGILRVSRKTWVYYSF